AHRLAEFLALLGRERLLHLSDRVIDDRASLLANCLRIALRFITRLLHLFLRFATDRLDLALLIVGQLEALNGITHLAQPVATALALTLALTLALSPAALAHLGHLFIERFLLIVRQNRLDLRDQPVAQLAEL